MSWWPFGERKEVDRDSVYARFQLALSSIRKVADSCGTVNNHVSKLSHDLKTETNGPTIYRSEDLDKIIVSIDNLQESVDKLKKGLPVLKADIGSLK